LQEIKLANHSNFSFVWKHIYR